MKKRILFILLSSLSIEWVNAQINVVPFAGMNSTKMYQSYGFEKGGAYGIAGVEFELRKKPTAHKALYMTLVTGVSYLSNGYYRSENFAYTALSFYTASVTDRKMEYVQVPVILRVNWQPFPLVEDWKVYFGAGLSNNFLMEATLHEQYTSVFVNSDLFAPPTTEQYEDTRDVKDLGVKRSLFSRYEFGMIYKRVQLSVRFSASITDLYYKGLETSWAVPAEHSEYLKAKDDKGKITEKYSEVVVGIRLFK